MSLPTVEEKARRLRRIGQVQQALLVAALAGGVMLVGGRIPMPSITTLLGGRDKYKFKYQAHTAIRSLLSKGLIYFEIKEDRKFVRLTPAGEKALEFEKRKTALNLEKKKRWNKRWRVVIFDIPEKRRGTRDRLRTIMQEAGFYRLQDSVWLYPHDCEAFIGLLKADLKLGSSVLYMVVEQIENDSKLREHFHIK